MNEERDVRHDVTWFQFTILVLSVYVLIALLAQTFFTLPPKVNAGWNFSTR